MTEQPWAYCETCEVFMRAAVPACWYCGSMMTRSYGPRLTSNVEMNSYGPMSEAQWARIRKEIGVDR